MFTEGITEGLSFKYLPLQAYLDINIDGFSIFLNEGGLIHSPWIEWRKPFATTYKLPKLRFFIEENYTELRSRTWTRLSSSDSSFSFLLYFIFIFIDTQTLAHRNVADFVASLLEEIIALNLL